MIIYELADAYRAMGLTVLELAGWQDRGHSPGPITPRGGGWHHTGDNIGLRSVFNPDGTDIRPDVPQPRANVFLPRTGPDVIMVAAGVAYHFGKGSRTALRLAWNGQVSAVTPDAVVANYPDDNDETAPGNASMIGHEVENLGDGQPLTPRQLWTIPRVAAAECLLWSWTPGHHMHHRQYTRRKPDMQWRGDLWAMTADAIRQYQEGDTMSAQDAAEGIQEWATERHDKDAATLREMLDQWPALRAQLGQVSTGVASQAGKLMALDTRLEAVQQDLRALLAAQNPGDAQ